MPARSLAAACTAALALACAASENGAPDPARVPLGGAPVEVVGIRAEPSPPLSLTWNSGFETPEQLVVRTPEAWAAAWARVWERHGEAPPLPAVDFDEELVVLVAIGTRPSAGYDVVITNAAVTEGVLQVGVLERAPGPGCATADVMTQPVAAARLPRFDGDVAFVATAATYRCE